METIIAFLFAALLLLLFILICMCWALSYISSVLYNLEKIATNILKRMEE